MWLEIFGELFIRAKSRKLINLNFIHKYNNNNKKTNKTIESKNG